MQAAVGRNSLGCGFDQTEATSQEETSFDKTHVALELGRKGL